MKIIDKLPKNCECGNPLIKTTNKETIKMRLKDNPYECKKCGKIYIKIRRNFRK